MFDFGPQTCKNYLRAKDGLYTCQYFQAREPGRTICEKGSFIYRILRKKLGLDSIAPDYYYSGFADLKVYIGEKRIRWCSTPSISFDLLLGSTVVGNGAWTGISDAYKVHWYTVQAVPEPGTKLALAAGLSAIAARRRRKS